MRKVINYMDGNVKFTLIFIFCSPLKKQIKNHFNSGWFATNYKRSEYIKQNYDSRQCPLRHNQVFMRHFGAIICRTIWQESNGNNMSCDIFIRPTKVFAERKIFNLHTIIIEWIIDQVCVCVWLFLSFNETHVIFDNCFISTNIRSM